MTSEEAKRIKGAFERALRVALELSGEQSPIMLNSRVNYLTGYLQGCVESMEFQDIKETEHGKE